MLISADISRMKRLIKTIVLKDICTLYKKTGETNNNGIITLVYDSGTNIQCQFIKISGRGSREEITSQNAKSIVNANSSFLIPIDSLPISNVDYILFNGIKYNIIDIANYSVLDAEIEIVVEIRK